MSRFLFTVLLFFGLTGVATAQTENKAFAIYLVRHAEKADNPVDKADPSLSPCGKLRAESLAVILADAGLRKVYSTPYERTLATARPSSKALGLEIETYDPQKLETFAQLLLDKGQDALVVGHSNTTPVLAGLLAGMNLEAFEEHIYDRLYQVIVFAEQTKMTILHQGFRCRR
jgi:broad specificity phosphatase PhoE